MSRVDDILTFWFGVLQDDKAYYDEWHSRWFTPNPQFDQEVRDRLLREVPITRDLELHRAAHVNGALRASRAQALERRREGGADLELLLLDLDPTGIGSRVELQPFQDADRGVDRLQPAPRVGL